MMSKSQAVIDLDTSFKKNKSSMTYKNFVYKIILEIDKLKVLMAKIGNYKANIKRSIHLSDFKKLSTFQWIIQFPEVFKKVGKFDVIVGNPPYGVSLEEIEKGIFSILYETSSNDTWVK